MNDRDKPQLDYARTGGRGETDGPLVAVLLCLTGLLCWSLCSATEVFHAVPPLATHEGVGVLWFLSVATALMSLVRYGRHPFKPQPWYILMNLFFNICGLIMSVLALIASVMQQ